MTLPTHEIVNQIRCEAKKAISDGVIVWLNSSNNPEDKKLAALIQTNPDYYLATLDPIAFGVDKQELIKKFKGTGIAYDFQFDITEENDIDPTLNLLGIFSGRGKTSLGVESKFDRKRQNTRIFTITDNFTDLIKNGPNCSEPVPGPDFVYPIAGRVGVGEMIGEFSHMTLFGNLAGPKDNRKGPPTMADTLTFTTTISLDASPKITLTPIGTGFHLSDFTFGVNNQRTDAHTVTVGLALAPTEKETTSEKETGTKKEGKTATETTTTAAPQLNEASLLNRLIPGKVIQNGLFVNAKEGITTSELYALQAVDQAILRSQIFRFGTPIILP